MHSVMFRAFGHENVIGDHKTTLEITSEEFLTSRGTCIIGIRSDLTLDRLDDTIKSLARLPSTKIQLKVRAGGISDIITGHGSAGISYEDTLSMVARTSDFECPRTLMVGADKAASDIDRNLVELLKDPEVELECELVFINQ